MQNSTVTPAGMATNQIFFIKHRNRGVRVQFSHPISHRQANYASADYSKVETLKWHREAS
jgi:hypothetical protein